jgi:hypothetical protein
MSLLWQKTILLLWKVMCGWLGCTISRQSYLPLSKLKDLLFVFPEQGKILLQFGFILLLFILRLRYRWMNKLIIKKPNVFPCMLLLPDSVFADTFISGWVPHFFCIILLPSFKICLCRHAAQSPSPLLLSLYLSHSFFLSLYLFVSVLYRPIRVCLYVCQSMYSSCLLSCWKNHCLKIIIINKYLKNLFHIDQRGILRQSDM